MKGVLTDEQQLSILTKIWGGDRDGYVFLPWISGKARTKEERKAAYHEGPAFAWPGDRDRILAHLAAHPHDDVYFTPCLFIDKRRTEQAADLERAMWADLDDGCNPAEIDSDMRPTIAWESSPGRFQAVWLLDRVWEGLSFPGRENHRLTRTLNADPSGWDTTQLLRVPGRRNHKPDYGTPQQGQLLWDGGPRYTREDIESWTLPEVPGVGGPDDDVDEDILATVDRHDVWGRVRLKVSKRVREFMSIRREEDISLDEGVDRSSVIWEISRELADAGCNVAEIIAVIRPSIWNKFRGRSDELSKLKAGAIKALAARKDKKDDGGALEDIEEIEKPAALWLNDVMTVRMRRPSWLISQVWSAGGCGFIAGDPKSYKSWTGLDMAVSVATGTPFLNDPTFRIIGGPQPVMYIQEEDPEIVVRDRLETVLEGKAPGSHWHGRVTVRNGLIVWEPPDMETIPLMFFVRKGFVASDPGWQAWLAEMATEHRIALTVVDTLGTTAGDVDTDRAQDLMTKILRPLRSVSQVTGSAVCVVHHNRKGSANERGGSRMLGSVALHAWVDDALYIHTRETKGGTTHVKVERESKAAVEHRWSLEVPRMAHTDVYGSRVVWSPVTGLWDAGKDDEGTGTEQARVSTPGGYKSPPAGSKMAKQVKAMGGRSAEHRVTLDRLSEALDMTPGAVMKQMRSALKNSLVAGDQSSGFYFTG